MNMLNVYCGIIIFDTIRWFLDSDILYQQIYSKSMLLLILSIVHLNTVFWREVLLWITIAYITNILYEICGNINTQNTTCCAHIMFVHADLMNPTPIYALNSISHGAYSSTHCILSNVLAFLNITILPTFLFCSMSIYLSMSI